MDMLDIKDPRKVQAKVRESDRRRTKFVRDVLGLDWTDARNFHLCIDSSVVGFAGSAEIIIRLVNDKRQSVEGDHHR